LKGWKNQRQIFMRTRKKRNINEESGCRNVRRRGFVCGGISAERTRL
jgi:hypothetical protein